MGTAETNALYGRTVIIVEDEYLMTEELPALVEDRARRIRLRLSCRWT